jgi:hypothetical protein
VAGGFMAHNLPAAQKAVDGVALNSAWVPSLMKALLVGEDSDSHVSNFVWAYNVDTK